MEKHPIHLKNPEFQAWEGVQRAVDRKELRGQGKVPNDPAERIEVYAERVGNVFLNSDETTRKRNIELFRDRIYDELIIQKENFPKSYFDLQKRIARERGRAVEEIPPDVREQMMDVVIQDQKVSLDAWINYLSSNEATYPAYFKLFVWKTITKLSQFDKERGEYKKRTDTTTAPFPDIYREPLAQIADVYEQVRKDNMKLKDSEIGALFAKKFSDLYAELTSKSLAASIENRENTQGQWVKYNQSNRVHAEKLYLSLEGKGTGWCTAGRSTANTQIDSGDFYVYYTNVQKSNSMQPRLAIRMDGKAKIGEVRGILPHQAAEPIMQEILDKKLGEFGPEADVHRKKSGDMRMLTDLERKSEKDEFFTKENLLFLYEINSLIEGFGYERDPRIDELRAVRNFEQDMLIVFECTKDQIAHASSEITSDTKAYVGPLEPGMFQRLLDIEHIYTSFPEGRIRRESVEVGSKTVEQLFKELRQAGITISNTVFDIMKSRDFILGTTIESIDLVRIAVKDLGLNLTKNGGWSSVATTGKIFSRAQELGLELCTADSGLNYRLKYKNQPTGKYINIGMKPIYYDGGDHVFMVFGKEDDFRLSSREANLGTTWDLLDNEFVFRLPKKQ